MKKDFDEEKVEEITWETTSKKTKEKAYMKSDEYKTPFGDKLDEISLADEELYKL